MSLTTIGGSGGINNPPSQSRRTLSLSKDAPKTAAVVFVQVLVGTIQVTIGYTIDRLCPSFFKS